MNSGQHHPLPTQGSSPSTATWIVIGIAAICLSACSTAPKTNAAFNLRNGNYHLSDQHFEAVDQRENYPGVAKEFGRNIIQLAHTYNEVPGGYKKLVPAFEEFSLFLKKKYGPQAVSGFLSNLESSIENYERGPQSDRRNQGRLSARTDRILAYRNRERYSTGQVLRAASWSIRRQLQEPSRPSLSTQEELPQKSTEPGIRISAPLNGKVFLDHRVQVRGEIKPTAGQKITGLQLILDETLLARTKGFKIETIESKETQEVLSSIPFPKPSSNSELQLQADGSFSTELHVPSGSHFLTVIGLDNQGKTYQSQVKIHIQDPNNIYALFVGVNDYDDSSIPDLSYCESDAEAFLKHVQSNLKVPASNIKSLKSESATIDGIWSAVKDLSRRIPKAELASSSFLFYFSGHGLRGGTEDDAPIYLLANDTNLENLEETAISNKTVADWFLRLVPTKTVVVVVDACHSGGLSFRDRLSVDWLAERPHILLTSCSPRQESRELDELGHGYFTYHLLEGLKGSADHNQDRAIQDLEAINYCREKSTAQQTTQFEARLSNPIILGISERP